jgi:hypothetical protein
MAVIHAIEEKTPADAPEPSSQVDPLEALVARIESMCLAYS